MKIRRIIVLLLAAAAVAAVILLRFDDLKNTTLPVRPTVSTAPAETPAPTPTPDPLGYLNGQLRIGIDCRDTVLSWTESEPGEHNVAIANRDGMRAAGYDIEWARWFAEYTGLEPVVLQISSEKLLESLKNGEIDVIVSGLLERAETRKTVKLTMPYKELEYGILVLEDSPLTRAVSTGDLSGYAVLGLNDPDMIKMIAQIADVKSVTPVETVAELAASIGYGKCDAAVIDVEQAEEWLAQDPHLRLVRFSTGDGFHPEVRGICAGVRIGENALYSQLNEAIRSLQQADSSGEMWREAQENFAFHQTLPAADAAPEEETEPAAE